MDLSQGDTRLLETDTARRLLSSTIPGRLGYTALDGSPRVVATWYVWTGDELVMSTFVCAPPLGISRPAHRLRALRADPRIAVIIDSEPQPPEVLILRGRVTITEVDGVAAEQAEAARRFLGAEGGAGYVEAARHPATRMARMALRPDWVGLLDYRTRTPDVMGSGGRSV
jgi:hypothetical protein